MISLFIAILSEMLNYLVICSPNDSACLYNFVLLSEFLELSQISKEDTYDKKLILHSEFSLVLYLFCLNYLFFVLKREF